MSMDVILGTAGHIDHGKTSLIRALTGINCDRLDEEKRRGITIDLGFAWLDLPDGRRMGIVDVPGHERFVKTMVAGAAGVDCMLLVIAADEGVMPQTREHLDICNLLGVKTGLVAITKTDMVDAEWLEMAREDVTEALRGTFLQGAPIIPVSSATGEGIETLRSAIFQLVAALPPRKGTDIMRLPVDRVFTLKGIGTVVTGTVVSGSITQSEDISVMPSGKPARARSLQVHSCQVKTASQGQRCAMNLQGLEVEDIERGDVIGRPDTLFPSRRWVARLTCLPSAPHPIRQRMEVHFHHGSRECAARIVFRDRTELAPGETAIAELHFDQPMVAIYGDHCVVRAHSPLRTIGGGIVVDPLPPILRMRDPLFKQKFANLTRLGELAIKEGSPLELLNLCFALCPLPGADDKHLAVLTGLAKKILADTLERAESLGDAICWDSANQYWIGKEAFETCVAKCKMRAEELHEREPLKTFFAHNALCSGWGENLPPKFTQKVLEEAVNRGILQPESRGLKLATHKTELASEQQEVLQKLLETYENSGFTPPTIKELCENSANYGGMDIKKMASLHSHLCATEQLVKVQEGLYYYRPNLDIALAKARQWFETSENLDISDMKTILGVSRKFAIPLLEYMDSTGMTYRVGNQRRLRKTAKQA